MRVCDFVVNYLESLGIDNIFLVTGRGALFLTDAVEKNPNTNVCCLHHEQAAAFATIAYSKTKRNLGACIVSTGCASTNAITGILSAWQDGIPCIFISGQNKLDKTKNYTKSPARTFGEQEADIIELVKSITKYSAFISEPSKIKYELEKAHFYALDKRPGPVWLDIPLDVQNMRVSTETLEGFSHKKNVNDTSSCDDISFIEKKLQTAERPTILIGAGVELDEGNLKLKKFVEKNRLPVIYTSAAPDAYGSFNSNSIGSIGVMGCSRAAAFVLQNSDLIINFGSRLPAAVRGEDILDFGRNAELIVVDENEEEFFENQNRFIKVIHTRPSYVLEKLLKLSLKNYTDWLEKCLHWKFFFKEYDNWENNGDKIDLHNLASVLSATMPEKCNFICDSGFADVILPTNIEFKLNQKCIHPVYQGAMGFAIPAAIGAFKGNGNTTICVVGEGSLMMNVQELLTISHLNLPIKIIVINNGGYAIIKRRQKELFRNRTVGTDVDDGLSIPNLERLAFGFGLSFSKVTNLNIIEQILKEKFSTQETEFIEIMGIENQSYLEMSFRKNEDNRWEQRPIEDQHPFMDREVFKREMN